MLQLGRFGRFLFALAIIGIGVETLICSHLFGQSTGPHYKIVPVIPWLLDLPLVPYLVGAIFVFCGVGLFFQRTRQISSVTVGAVMVLCGLVFDLPRHPNILDPVWRTNLLEPIVIGCLAWLALGKANIPTWLDRASRYLIAFSLIVFGAAHFQVLTSIAKMVPGWIPWHWFWTVLFGLAFIAAGLSFATGFASRLTALGAGLMFALWTLTIHLPALINSFHATQDPDKWSDVFIVVALCGGFWALVSGSRERDRTER